MKKFLQNKAVQSWLWLAALLAVWELVTRLELVNTYVLPSLSKVLKTLGHELFFEKLGMQVLNSLIMILIGFLLSFALSVVITGLSVWLTPVESLFSMISTIMSPLPAVALMPLVIMWFGISTGAMLALITHGVLWAMIRHLLDGLRSIPAIHYEWGKNIGMRPRRLFTDILIYSIMPELIAGIRISWGRAWRALLSAEMIFGMIGSLGGLGYYIHTARAFANITNVMVGVVVIIIIGISVEYLLFAQIEKHTIQKWGMTKV